MTRLAFVRGFLDDIITDAYDYDICNHEVCHPIAKRITGKYVESWSGFLKLVCIPKPLKYKYWFTEEEVYFLEYHKPMQ